MNFTIYNDWPNGRDPIASKSVISGHFYHFCAYNHTYRGLSVVPADILSMQMTRIRSEMHMCTKNTYPDIRKVCFYRNRLGIFKRCVKLGLHHHVFRKEIDPFLIRMNGFLGLSVHTFQGDRSSCCIGCSRKAG